jgi:polysaccharide biosynthesis protein PslH
VRVLYLSPRQCWPPTSGAKLRDYHLARALGRSSELSYVYYTEPGSPPVDGADMPFCSRLVSVPKPRPYAAAKVARGLAGKWPLPILNYTSPRFLDAVRGLAILPFDVIHVDSIHLAACEAALRPVLGNAAVIYNWHNIESELMFRYSVESDSWARKPYAKLTAKRLERAEKSILSSALGHIVCSERERAELANRAPHARIAVIENGVDTQAFELPRRDAQLKRIVFVGAMRYHANVEAAQWFARTIWPAIQKRFPEFMFTIVGADPAPEVVALRELAGVEVTGTVPDVRPYYRDAFAAVVPLRVGAGTRLKILEAMAANVPVISTTLGAEGLKVENRRNILIADDESAWLPGLTSLSDAHTRQRLAKAGRALVCELYDWGVIGTRMVEKYREWLETR